MSLRIIGAAVIATLMGISVSAMAVDVNSKVVDQLVNDGVGRAPAEKAFEAYQWAVRHHLARSSMLGIADYSEPSNEKRFWVVNIKTAQLFYNGYVAQGKNSGFKYAVSFSNARNSDKTSLGLYEATSPYYGKHGQSLRLEGLEAGVNDNAMARAVVLHPAPYASPSFVREHGYLGRSWGCFAVNPTDAPKLINLLKGGGLIFAYAPTLNHGKDHYA